MAIEIVDFPIQNGDFPWQTVSSPEGNGYKGTIMGWPIIVVMIGLYDGIIAIYSYNIPGW